MDNQQKQTAAGAPHALDAAKVDAWIKGAQPGAQLCYFTGLFAGNGSAAVNQKLQAEADRKMIFLVQRRRYSAPFGFDYLAVRSTRPADGPAQPTLAQQVDAWDRAKSRARECVS